MVVGETWAQSRTMKILGNYLNLPITMKGDAAKIELMVDGQPLTNGDIRLAATDSADYWMFYDLSVCKGKKLTVSYAGDASALEGVFIADTIVGQSGLYHEDYRQQFHFSTKRGWINDPNGIIYYDGEYHIYYQYNPLNVDWGNLNWGHAVSRDLIHWEELPIALRKDADGDVYSGSAVVDYDNVSGLGSKKNPAMLAFYTLQASDGQTQCLAYSLDHGRTWTKYAGNPVVDTKMKNGTWHNRDPKVFWYAPGKHWVMALHEKDGHSFYTSRNLLDWTYQSHTPGFWECPELFCLPVDGDEANLKWVLTGASGTYMIGSFDGKKFTPESGKHYYATGYLYAGQTFNNLPATDRRRIQIGWASVRKEGMPFTGYFHLPVELTLRNTKDGVRLCSYPVEETEALFTPIFQAENLTMEQANEKMKTLGEHIDGLRVKARIRLSHPTNAGLLLDGQKILDYDMNFNRVNGTFYSPQDPTSMELEVALYIDRAGIDGYVDGGLYAYYIERSREGSDRGIAFWSLEPLEILKLEVCAAASIH